MSPTHRSLWSLNHYSCIKKASHPCLAGKQYRVVLCRCRKVRASPGQPGTAEQPAGSGSESEGQVAAVASALDGCELVVNSRMVALIAYLQRLGKVPEGASLAAASEEAGQ